VAAEKAWTVAHVYAEFLASEQWRATLRPGGKRVTAILTRLLGDASATQGGGDA